MVDTNVFDLLAVDDALLAECLRAMDSGSLILVVTHVQADELAAVKEAVWRALLLDAMEHLAVQVVTARGVFGVSRWGLSSYFSEVHAARHASFVGKARRRAKDALILATAEREGIPVVTMESKPSKIARVRAHFPGVELWSVEDLRVALSRLDPPNPIGVD